MQIEQFLKFLSNTPQNVQFSETIAVIDTYYDFSPTRFVNGSQTNEAGQNNGSCKIFSFAKLHNLSPEQTLACFGDFYRIDVLENPNTNDHQNIRNFIREGWTGVQFDGSALTLKKV